jgi:hypothetical protein
VIVKCFLGNCDVVEISRPPYSPDLTPDEFFLFPKVENALRGEGFRLLRTSGKNFTTELNASSLDAFSDRFAQVLEKCKKCFALKRD